VWKDAATQMFFTLSLAFGALIAFASYMPYHNQCMNDAYTVVFINCGTSLFAGIVVYSILGYREVKTGISANKVSCACTTATAEPYNFRINTPVKLANGGNVRLLFTLDNSICFERLIGFFSCRGPVFTVYYCSGAITTMIAGNWSSR
jgi:SNF family Na+-dependent transporter